MSEIEFIIDYKFNDFVNVIFPKLNKLGIVFKLIGLRITFLCIKYIEFQYMGYLLNKLRRDSYQKEMSEKTLLVVKIQWLNALQFYIKYYFFYPFILHNIRPTFLTS